MKTLNIKTLKYIYGGQKLQAPDLPERKQTLEFPISKI